MITSPGSPDGFVYLVAAVGVVALTLLINRNRKRKAKNISFQSIENWLIYLLLLISVAAAIFLSFQ